MQKKVVKKKIIVSFVIFLLVSGVFAGVIVYLYSMQTKTKEKHDWLKNDISATQRNIKGLSDQAIEFAEAIGVWESLDEDAKKLEGIRISQAKLVLDELEAKHKLSNIKLAIAKPEEVNINKSPELDNELIRVWNSNVSIDFSAVTDVDAFNFVTDLMESLPGYINIDTFSVERVKDVEKVHLEMIFRGERPALVNGKLRFVWRDFKYMPPEEGTPQEGAEEG